MRRRLVRGARRARALSRRAQETDAFGAPKFSRSAGRPIVTIRDHDVEEFGLVLKQWHLGCHPRDGLDVPRSHTPKQKEPESEKR
ncbi:putative metallopeptidase [Sinorhizobium numidicum]|uniref:Metallopeptidase n=1 Tax=Sinorhizobium numidicum TaxID=680248 RepID=A0ABY8CR22_9HYPH|nr:putative metallopeptidase [Sinorhizobium numidicum]WEX75112.1 putative metallopeptidase [Sinorhizobium numidicum]WEX81106.1 putative metallopeptidase [Sinorhizobium numidicum]